MLRRKMIMQTFISALGQLIISSTTMGITLIGAEQQVGARSAWMYEGTEYIAAFEYDPELPQGLGDADLSVSVSKNGADGSASLTSQFEENQVTVSCSTEAIAQWGEHPENAFDVHGNCHGEFHLRFTTGSSPAYIQIEGLLNVSITYDPSVYPEDTRAWVRLERIEEGELTRIWTAELDGADPQTSVEMDDVISLEADQEYFLIAYATSNAPAWGEYPGLKIRSASFFLTAKIESATIEITGPEWAIVYNLKNPKHKLRESPSIQLEAIGGPPGGHYLWVIGNGRDKAEIFGSNTEKQIELRGTHPSANENDVEIKVIYTVDSQVYEDTHCVSIRKPTFLNEFESPDTDPYFPPDVPVEIYWTKYYFAIYDQWGAPMKAAPETHIPPIPWRERLKFCSVQPKWFRSLLIGTIKRTEMSGATSDGTLQDDLIPPKYDLPKDFCLKLNQNWYVAGWLVSVRCITYYQDLAESVVGVCTK